MLNEVIYQARVFDCECKGEVSDYANRINEIAPYVDYGNISLNGSLGTFDLYIPIDREEDFLNAFDEAKIDRCGGVICVSIIKVL